MAHRERLVPLLVIALTAAACTLPGAASPTPFTFPTPNLTLTAIFAPAANRTPAPATLAPPGPGPTPTQAPGGASATMGPLTSRLNGAPATALFLSTPPAIDGDLSEWTDSGATANQCVFGCASRSGDSDLSAVYHLGYDLNSLYLAVKIRDETHVQVAGAAAMYKGDDVEIQLDTDLPGDFYVTSLSRDDYQIGLSAGNFASNPPAAYRWYPASLAGRLTNVVVKGKSGTGGYTLEAKIPWSVFGVTPASGAHFGFALSLSDDDTPGSAVQQSMVSNVATRKLIDPTSWGTLILAPSGGS